ncbi:MAG: CDP-alcohol phosphatidyltransferase family protein [Acidobacteriota bacterium]
MTVSAPGILWVMAPSDTGVRADTQVLGVALARRVAVAAERAEFSRILFAEAPGLATALAGMRAERVGPSGAAPPPIGPARLVILRSGVLPATPWLRALLEETGAGEAGADVFPSASAAVFDVPRADEAVEALVRSGTALPGAVRLRAGSPVAWSDAAGPAGLVELANAGQLPGVERRLLRGLIKDTEGFFSRHFNRRISLAITRRLARTPMTPNAMTAISVAVGLAGAGFFLSGEAPYQFIGSLLFLGHSILDGCDGELARLKFQESRLGGVLDFWGDNVVHCAVFACLAAGWGRDTSDARPLVAGALAVAGTLLSAGFVARFALGGAADRPQFTSVTRRAQTRLSRVADMLARRDFIYLVVLLSAFGKARWFLALAAIGAPLFFLTLLAIEASGRRLGRDLP